MPDLRVPFDILENFADTMESIRTRMNATGRTFDNYGDDVGDDGVRDALNSFVDNWRDGRDEIDGQLTSMKEIARGVVEGFTELDEGNAAALTGDGSGGDGSQEK